jgi:hypothetical protein
MEKENLSGQYWDKLKESTTHSSSLILLSLYNDIFDLNYDDKKIPIFAKLVKVYGRNIVYYAVIDCSSIPDVQSPENAYGLLNYFCKKRLELVNSTLPSASLADFIDSAMKLEEKIRKQKITPKEPFDE